MPSSDSYTPIAAELENARAEVINLRAALRREQDARAALRFELNQEHAQHRSDVEGAASALAQVEYEKAIVEAENQRLRAERDQARRQLVDAMQTIEEAAVGRQQLEQPGEIEEVDRG